MQDFHECPYCTQELEQWSVRFYRSDRATAGGWRDVAAPRRLEPGEGSYAPRGLTADVSDAEGLTLLSLCPSERCGYYVLRYRDGLFHWDRDVEAARLLRTLFGE